MAQRLLPFWANATGRTEKPSLFDATLKVAAKLGDPSVAAALLQPFALAALKPKAASRLADLLDSYGFNWCRTLLQKWALEENHELPQTRLSWMDSTCQSAWAYARDQAAFDGTDRTTSFSPASQPP
jgi:hypothetical protein